MIVSISKEEIADERAVFDVAFPPILKTTMTCLIALALPLLGGCGVEDVVEAPEVRPVRVVAIEKRDNYDTVSLTGTVEAETQVNLAFRIDGRMRERNVNVGDNVDAGTVVALLDPENEENALRSARAEVSAASARLLEAQNDYDRQETLLERGFTTRARYDQAAHTLQSAKSQLDAAEARLLIAEDRLSYTQLVADAGGVVTAVGAEPGEVVQAGRMVVQLARDGGRDAVFDVPARVKDTVPPNPVIEVELATDPAVKASGRVREISPRADPVTGTFRVSVGLDNPPPAMRLGSTVVGRLRIGRSAGVRIPAVAVTRSNEQPAVWIVDPSSKTVSLRNIQVDRFDPAYVSVGHGLAPGDIVVTAGVQALRPGQQVRLLGDE